MIQKCRQTFFIMRIKEDGGSVQLSQKDAKMDRGDGKSLLLIGCQTAELFTATGWKILPLYKGLCKSAA